MVPVRRNDQANEHRVQSPKDSQTYSLRGPGPDKDQTYYSWPSNMGRGKPENLEDGDRPDDGGTSKIAGPTRRRRSHNHESRSPADGRKKT
ncbi:MAG: hypothetical protein GY696_00755 [Gammaproteobacteria bacterium]|nr:hypothetical protein [Gammaproteobacteria bacterium]